MKNLSKISLLKALGIILLNLAFIAVSFSQKNNKGKDKESVDCNDSFYSTISKISDEDAGTATYSITVNYTGEKSYGLSHFSVSLPECSTASDVTNSRGWSQELNSVSPHTGLYGFKVDNISNFGEDKSSDSFTVTFTVSSDSEDCFSGDCNFSVAYKAGQCLVTEDLAVDCPENNDDNDDTGEDEEDDDDLDEEDGEDDDEDDNDDNDSDDEDDGEDDNNDNKITICHYPPGNPDNAQTLTISESAWPAHEAHGDTIGGCDTSEEEDPEEEDPEEEDPEEEDPEEEDPEEEDPEEEDPEEEDPEEEDPEEEDPEEEDPEEEDPEEEDPEEEDPEEEDPEEEDPEEEDPEVEEPEVEDPEVEEPEVEEPEEEEPEVEEPEVEEPEEEEPEVEEPEVEEPEVEEPEVEDPEEEEPEVEEPEVEEPEVEEEKPYTLPTARIESKNEEICVGEDADFEVALTGNGPWTVEYKIGEEISSTLIEDNNFSITCEDEGEITLLSVTDVNGKPGSVEGAGSVTVAEMPSATILGGGIICEGESTDLLIELNGVGPWVFTYTDGTDYHTVTTEESTYSLSVSEAGAYQITNISGASCTNDKPAFSQAIVEITKTPHVNLTGTSTSCVEENGRIEFAMEGDGPFTIYYTDGDEEKHFTTENTGHIVEISQNGDYEITKVVANGCEGTFSGNVNYIRAEKMAAKINLKDEYCAGEPINLNLEMLSGQPASVSWTTNGDGELKEQDGSYVYIPSDFDEEVSFKATMNDECVSADVEKTTSITKVSATFDISPEVNDIIRNVDYEFIPMDMDADSYEWSFSDGTTESLQTSVHKFEETGYHTVSLKVKKGDCEDSETVEIEIIENNNLFIPSVFNPESTNSENNRVKIYGEGIAKDNFKFQIVNRWGLVVYQTNNLEEATQQGWNGLRKGEPQENGVYTFTVLGEFDSGKKFEKTGTVTLVK